MLDQRVISNFDLSLITGLTTDEIVIELGDGIKHRELDVMDLDLPDTVLAKLVNYFDSLPIISGKQRRDADGLFWQLELKTTTVKPIRTWENADYIPYLEEARGHVYNEFTNRELVDSDELFVYDIEVYANYCLIAFTGIDSGKEVFFELSEYMDAPNYKKLQYICDNKKMVSFNGIGFDVVIMALFLAGKTTSELQRATSMLIEDEMRPYEVLKAFKVRQLKIDQIDIMEVCIGQGSLKLYGARLHCESIIDLPFVPGTKLCKDKQSVVKLYCRNDLSVTRLVYLDRLAPITLRESMSLEYGVDMRSRSDAQCAEDIIGAEYKRLTAREPVKSEFQSFTFKYRVPSFVNFKTDNLQNILSIMSNAELDTGVGKLVCPDVDGLLVSIGTTTYRLGMGGLHSTEESISYEADDDMLLMDIDVASYYPKTIINQRLTPDTLGQGFLGVYEHRIFEPRLIAKKAKDKVKDGMYKIVLNGSFGKFGSKYSILYAPRLLAQVTFTGQLALLMLIERLELVGISVVSGNTDGIIVYCKRSRYPEIQAIVKRWEKHCDYMMEETHYSKLCNRDVNNYIAIKTDGSVKLKGVYAEAGIGKNPVNTVCNDAVVAHLTKTGTIEDVIRNEMDIRKFLTVRTVKGGACKDGVYLGKVCRYYHSTATNTYIIYANSGNRVPMSANCRPLMRLPDALPADLDISWYIDESYRILDNLGITNVI